MPRVLCIDTEPSTVGLPGSAAIDVVVGEIGYRTGQPDLRTPPHEVDLILCDLERAACFDRLWWGPGKNDNIQAKKWLGPSITPPTALEPADLLASRGSPGRATATATDPGAGLGSPDTPRTGQEAALQFPVAKLPFAAFGQLLKGLRRDRLVPRLLEWWRRKRPTAISASTEPRR